MMTAEFLQNPIGFAMVAPTLAAHGSEEQRARFLPGIDAGEVWCQLFSEPGAGSDLAGLATMAVSHDGGWVVNGQKVWTSLAHVARWGLLLARTTPDAPKHRGLTCFACDMHGPGVEVRPLRQMTGEAEFNEVYLTDVVIPDECRIGPVDAGWRVGMTTLANERVLIGDSAGSDLGPGPIEEALRVFGDRPRGAVERDRLMRLWVESEVLRLTNLRAGALRRHGSPGPEGSVAKLALAGLNQRIAGLTLELLGAEGQLYPAGYEFDQPEVTTLYSAGPQQFFLRARANSIEGGTSEIQRNVMAERILGLPTEPGGDRDQPWNRTRR